MSDDRSPLEAVRVELYAPVASFRDPMFPGVSRGLPVPPPSTLRGLLAAATGAPSEPVAFGMSAYAEGGGIDAETYHPIATDGSNPSSGGRVRPVKGGTTLRERPFLAGVHVTLWIPAPDAERIAAALRRPVWGLRLGRSQDLVHVTAIDRVTLQPADRAMIGHAIAPMGGHAAPQAETLRLADQISLDRLDTAFSDYLWCAEPPPRLHPVNGAFQDGGRAVWIHHPPFGGTPAELHDVLGKSAGHSALGRPELLTEHSEVVRNAALDVARRIGSPGVLAARPTFWKQVEVAALLHDAGKLAEGFQLQVKPGGQSWGERHEVLSLAYVALLTRGLPEEDRRLIRAGVAFHHECLTSSSNGGRELRSRYPPEARWEAKFGRNSDPEPGMPRIQVPTSRHHALLSWLAGRLGVDPVEGEPRKLWELSRDMFARVSSDWGSPVSDEEGLVAVLLQGAVTLADRSGSAHVPLQTHMPLRRDFLKTLPSPYDHQRAAAETRGHLILCAPTGSGKTEAGLAWASTQLDSMEGLPRLVWVLPYRASIDAARTRFRKSLDPPFGAEEPQIGVLHATAAHTLLSQAVADDCPPGPSEAKKARANANAMRLFAQRVRVSTPYQLLRAAIAGPRYSSVLLEQANAIIVLDELHAYDPATFGRICAAMALWKDLGSRIAVLSATLAPPMIELLRETLGDVAVHEAPTGTAPERHRLVIDAAPIDAEPSLDRVRGWLGEGHSVLVVANSVAKAQHLYAELADAARKAFPGDPDATLLLHSRFRGRDRAEIEKKIQQRYPEREPGEPPRLGGLVVSTQVLEVSLCLDFDRGVSELAPIESIAQRAGRVNRRGRHPNGAVEFRVHDTDAARPYDERTLDAARLALRECPDERVSEQTVNTWLTLAYDTDWGRGWAAEARHHREQFAQYFLTFPDPFHDRSEFLDGLEASFDSVEALWVRDVEEYRALNRLDPLLAGGLLIPVRYSQIGALNKAGRVQHDSELRLWIIDAPYDPETGLTLSVSAKESETIL